MSRAPCWTAAEMAPSAQWPLVSVKPEAVVVFVSQPSIRAVTVTNWARVIVWPRPKVLLVMPDMRP